MFNKRNLKWLSVLATIIMAFVQLGGALVTKTGSEDGCGSSWPLCHGALLPQNLPIDTIIELSHRAVSGLSLIVVLWLAITAWKHIGYIREVKPLAIISIAFLLVQALIGAAAVIWQQNSYVLALHFGISLISFSSVFVLMLIIFEVDKKYEADELYIRKPLRRLTWIMTGIVYLTIYTGALVRHAKASLAYGGWPLPFHDIIPHTEQDWVQFAHRGMAFITFFWIMITFIHAVKNYSENRTIRYGYTTAFILIILQVITGALSVMTNVNLFIALLHALFITILFGMIAYFIMLMLRTIRSEKIK
ncbi:heme A synthase [Staphylococcus sp. EG-SA-6]|uniref:Heme A synthase n=3 Tax=Staphylococcus TaxID=1279 RepID=CTAA_STAHJ|nr:MULTISPECIES: heme A synthase [Staphylococcus]Q4L5C9.1 RecName: Full=Heme A synthase; Short=HAS; AltName: Full=Cytochrome aa3-controlling protein [Staphylococcus haemolyticus JCSC1435]KDP53662.1 cytochrome oxidase assembly protein [Staphylococcus aureus subsp. aureus CO-98]MBN4935787.1 heme A synthase [Staphylococcus sp. EG-SA-6]AMW23107.1 heme A synthase [Staphylococcus haemolyticus]AUV67827.1 heme A synthase [Staphylococcus haemolyticus]AUV70205.1 heme A synthase [Staphylococcus haemolyt